MRDPQESHEPNARTGAHRKGDRGGTSPRSLSERELLSLLRIIEVEGAQASLFRIPQDARDRGVEKLEDRVLSDDLPDDPLAWSRQVVWNLHASGPSRRELHRDQPSASADELQALEERRPRFVSRLPSSYRDEFLQKLEQALSEKEKILFHAIRAGVPPQVLEQACGMTAWAIDVRWRRIVAKGKKLAISLPLPPLLGEE